MELKGEEKFLEQLVQCLTIMNLSLISLKKGQNPVKNLCVITRNLERAIKLFTDRRAEVQEESRETKAA